MAELQKGSKITARLDSNVNVLDTPRDRGVVVKTFASGEPVGYATTDEIFINRTDPNDPTVFIRVLYFSEQAFSLLPLAVGYVDKDSVEIGLPEAENSTDTDTPIQDDQGAPLDESMRDEGIVVKTPDGKIVIVVPSPKTEPKGFPKWKELPDWAKVVIIGVASVIVIVSGVWIYKQLKKPSKKS